MRTPLVATRYAFALLLTAANFCAGGTVLKYTASYYRIHAEEFLDKEVKLYVLSLNPIPGLNPDKLPKGYKAFVAHTAYEGKYGEMIAILIPDEDVEKVLKKYGTSFNFLNLTNARKMEGILKEFRENDKRDFFVVLPKSGSGDDSSTGGTKTDRGRDTDKAGDARPERDTAAKHQYPIIQDGKLFTGEDGVPVEDVIKFLRKEGKILF
ncbi:MAG: hypothetical protein A3K19_04200 [Lentisphaerae bacterium RIFOXYB12_FULL_65_16]|nr:MAG: hypothetical protein A3K18_09500 [Lentisphaerae bacterium RIFOXYA12_64_32]OGV84285.1 MAG: hypothetical protein A3K19_04200 [Lentisphaerae bacterium RIFOXYB12_FULL_65_16]